MVDESIEAATASERQLLEMTDQIKSLEVYEPWPTEDAVNPTIEEGEEGEEVEDDAMSDHPRKLLLMSYFRKFLGVENKHPPPINGVLHSVLSSILAFTGILLVAVTDYWFLSRSFESEDHSAVAMLTGAQAATAGILDTVCCLLYFNSYVCTSAVV